jgi:hypothetical protein
VIGFTVHCRAGGFNLLDDLDETVRHPNCPLQPMPEKAKSDMTPKQRSWLNGWKPMDLISPPPRMQQPAVGLFNYTASGIPLRDYFAGQWLAGCSAKQTSFVQIAEEAYHVADAMLAARDGNKEAQS